MKRRWSSGRLVGRVVFFILNLTVLNITSYKYILLTICSLHSLMQTIPNVLKNKILEYNFLIDLHKMGLVEMNFVLQ